MFSGAAVPWEWVQIQVPGHPKLRQSESCIFVHFFGFKFISQFLFIIIMCYVYVHDVCMLGRVHMPRWTRGDERIAFRSWFSTSTVGSGDQIQVVRLV